MQPSLVDPTYLSVQFTAFVTSLIISAGLAALQVFGRMIALQNILQRIGPIIYGICGTVVCCIELALCYLMLAPFGVWSSSMQRQIAMVARLSKRLLWPWVLWCCPWISVKVFNRHLMNRVGEDRTRPTMFVSNHTSFFDAPFVLSYFSYRVARLHRVIAMGAVSKMPLLGQIFKYEQHIPVHFASDQKDCFKVQEHTRKQLWDSMEKAMEDKEVLVVYPEGQINAKDLKRLGPFREGSFRCAIRHDAAVWGWVSVGGNITWPYKAAMGGRPARITATPLELAPDGALAFLRQHGIPTEPREGQTPEELLDEQSRLMANKVQLIMQETLTGLHSDNEKLKSHAN